MTTNQPARPREPEPLPRSRPAPGRRPPWRQLAETRGWVGGHAQPTRAVALRADDGTRLVASHLEGPTSSSPAVLLAHGFAAHRRKPAYAALADELSAVAHVLSLDLRGHGGSGGRSALGGDEWRDVAAGVAWLRARGHAQVVAVGVSMGSTSVAHAVHRGVGVDAFVMVSGPAVLHEVPRTPPMRRLRRLWDSPVARGGMRVVFGITLVAPHEWDAPPHPVDAVRDTAVPALVVHGVDDAYFPVEDAEALALSAAGRLWLEPAGFGHAEDGFDPAGRFARTLGAGIVHALDHREFPDREHAVRAARRPHRAAGDLLARPRPRG